MNTVSAAIEAAGGDQVVARHFGIRYQAVQKWHRKLPPRRASGLAALTGGRFTAQELCPSFPWEQPTPPAPSA